MNTKRLAAIGLGLAAFIGAPLYFYAISDAPFRSVLKDALSIATMIAFALMLGQFFLSRSNKTLLEIFKPPQVQKVHKFIAYGAIAVILLHPVMIVFPRYFEGGVEPWTAFVEMLSNFTNPGLLAGMVAWVALVVLGVTAYFRTPILKRMKKKYRGWRAFHALLVLLFILPATYHVLALGRHVGWGLGIYLVAVLVIGLIQLARIYPDRFPAKLFQTTEATAK